MTQIEYQQRGETEQKTYHHHHLRIIWFSLIIVDCDDDRCWAKKCDIGWTVTGDDVEHMCASQQVFSPSLSYSFPLALSCVLIIWLKKNENFHL